MKVVMVVDDRFLVEENLGGGGLSGLDPLQVREVLAVFTQLSALRDMPTLAGQWAKIAMGLTDIEVPERDSQYGDRAWREHPLYRRLAQGHLAWTKWVQDKIDDTNAGWETQERGRYVTDIVTAALSPANFPITNPAVTRKAIETGGRSLVRGGRTFLRDVVKHGGMPRMTDTRPFVVGQNTGCSPGSVVYREEIFELIHYAPTTDTVHERPLLFVPPELGRYYILDLAPQRSLVEQAVASGFQTFMLVWRNPRKDPAVGHGKWGLDDYVSAVIRAFDVVRTIAGTDDLNLLGFCAGGFTSLVAQAYLATLGEQPVHSATYLVTMMDTRKPNLITPFTTRGVRSQLTTLADKAEVIDAQEVANHFAWLRPKDLVFAHVINNWLLGEDPSAYDLLAWNDDAANMSAKFVRDATYLMATGALVEPGAATVLGAPIDLSKVKVDNFVVAAQTDHITTWRPCYMTTQLVGGDCEMVVVNKGHIQTIVSPIAKSRQKYWFGPADAADPDEWMQTANQCDGSWWPRWSQWLSARSGPEVAAPERLGNRKYPPREPAPGRYVLEK